MHLNRDYVYSGGDYDLEALFRLKNLTRLASKRRCKVVAALEEMRKMLAAKQPPTISVGPQCNTPYTCPFYDHCHEDEPEHSIEHLPRLGSRLREQLAAMGVRPSPPRCLFALVQGRNRRAELRASLLAYCKRDTEALLDVFKPLGRTSP
jgi:hypothetical protein